MKKILAGLLSLVMVFFGGLNVAFANDGVDRDCGEFDTADQVWEYWNSHGGDEDPSGLDRDSDGLPCEGLTDGTDGGTVSDEGTTVEEPVEEAQPVAENEETVVEEDGTEAASEEDEEVAEDDEEVTETTTEEGGELADTATSNPFMMLIGIAIAGSGAILFSRKKRLE